MRGVPRCQHLPSLTTPNTARCLQEVASLRMVQPMQRRHMPCSVSSTINSDHSSRSNSQPAKKSRTHTYPSATTPHAAIRHLPLACMYACLCNMKQDHTPNTETYIGTPCQQHLSETTAVVVPCLAALPSCMTLLVHKARKTRQNTLC